MLNHLRIRYLIALVVGLAVTAGLVATAAVYSRQQEAAMRQQNERTMEKLTDSVLQGLQSVMLAGSADMAHAYAESLKRIPEISEIRVLRTSGEEAFLDNSTIEDVNRRRGEDIFPLHERETTARALASDDPNLRRVLESRRPVALYQPDHLGAPSLTFLAPIENQEICYKCHGKAHPLRGVLLLNTSLADVERDILRVRQQTLVLLGISLMAAMLLTGYLMGRAVVTPIEAVTRAMARIREGDLEHRVAVPGRDELGRMANCFNLMADDVQATYAGLKGERDKLTTIILGAAEGIAVADGQGRVALVNPAMEIMTGKSAEQIMAAGLDNLLDDPAAMQHWLAGGDGETPVANHNGRSFQVYAATLKARDGRPAGAAVLLRDITEETRLEGELRRLSTTDALTGLFNRRHLDDVLAREFSRAERAADGSLSIIMSDVDHFKKFNDTHGHDQGDRVLQAVARVLRDHVRQHDVPCRYGGEEFLVILPHTDAEGARLLAEQLRAEVAAMVVDGLKVTISLGVATYPDITVAGAPALIERADAALYQAKHEGRNRVAVAPGGSA